MWIIGNCLALLVGWASSELAGSLVVLPELREEALMAHVRFLAAPELAGRAMGTAQERVAASYIRAVLESAEVPPLPGGLRDQRIPLPVPVSERDSATRNVLGYVAGSRTGEDEEWIVVGAHVDHLGSTQAGSYYPGAEDNATGVSLLLEVSKALLRRDEALKRSVVFVFFGGEERGLVGSRHFVNQPPVPLTRVVAMVNVDMIGRPLVDQKQLRPLKGLLRVDDRRAIGVVGALGRPGLCELVDRACADSGVQVFGTKNIPFVSSIVEKMAENRGDHAPFEEAGIPTLFFGSGESDDYHRVTDTVEKIAPALLALRARAVYRTIELLAEAPHEALRASLTPTSRPEAAPAPEPLPQSAPR